jgi:hypothetical protein
MNDGFLARLEVLYVSGRDDEGDILEDMADANSPWRQNHQLGQH